MAKRLVVIGLDCAAPRFVFGPDAFHLPCIQELMARGVWGRLRSCDPPITVPAWAVMTTGMDPGELGIYGFRLRQNRSRDGERLASARDVQFSRVWDWVSEAARRAAVVGVPQTYPPGPVNGVVVPGLLTPDSAGEFTHPPSLSAELEEAVGAYQPDVGGFRTQDKEGLLHRLHEHLENRFAVARYVMERDRWDFFMMVEMGVDRLHHGFWKYCDAAHPKYAPGNPYEKAFETYYRALDDKIDALLKVAGSDVTVMIVSDHGAKALHGAVAINEWLIREGYLRLKSSPEPGTPLTPAMVDWTKTRAWGTGGYCGRIDLNLSGRDPEGIVAQRDHESLRREIADRIKEMTGPDGGRLGNRALKPEAIYRKVTGIAPDLLVYFGNLHWRAAGTVGHGEILLTENDTGPDDANHDFDGIFILADKLDRGGMKVEGANILDIAPTMCAALGITPPRRLEGRPLC